MSESVSALDVHPAPARGGVTRRLLRNPLGLGAVAVLTLMAVASVLAPVLSSFDPTRADGGAILAPPGGGHLLGADGAGRDVWSRLLHGGRISLLAGLLTMVVAVTAGVPAGLVGGYVQGRVDTALGWVSDALMSVPAMVVLFAVIAAWGSSTWITMSVFGLLLAPSFYRLVRSVVRAVSAELYVDAARVSGLGDLRIIRRHVLRVVRAPIIIQCSFVAGIAIVIQAGVEFLGLGEPTSPSWGAMLGDAFTNIYAAPGLIIWPGLTIGLTVGSYAILGTALRDALEDSVATMGVPRRAQVGRSAAVSAPGDTRDLFGVEGLRVGYPRPDGAVTEVVGEVSLTVRRGEIVGLVGESGSGKTQTAFALMGLLPAEAQVDHRAAWYDGRSLDLGNPGSTARLRGRRIGYVPQEPMSNLDPSYRIGAQLGEPMRHHLGLSRSQAKARALELLSLVGIGDPQRVYAAFPYEISGGMAQRVLIAGAISCDPDLLIADEPTTALDVTVQAELLDLLRSLRQDRGLGVLLVTHDLGVVADCCDRVAVMRHGAIVESTTVGELFAAPHHEYARSLLAAAEQAGPVRRYQPLTTAPGGAR